MSRLGMSHCPVFILHKHHQTGLGRFLARHGELIFWATSSWNGKGSGEVVCSSVWCKCADAGASLLTKDTGSGEIVPEKAVSGAPPLRAGEESRAPIKPP